MNNIEKKIIEQIKELRKEEETLIKLIREKELFLNAQLSMIRQCNNSDKIDECIESLVKKRDEITKIYLQ